jgi:2-haloacid dehalogenase
MARAVVFDINETVLDLGALDPFFAEWFGDVSVRRAWFAQTIHFALTLAATHDYRSFGAVGIAALEAVADQREIVLPADAVQTLRYALLRLPAHPDAKPALELLRSAEFSTVALSNNPLAALHEPLRNAGIAPLFDLVISVEEAGALKPSPAVYHLATERLQLPPRAIWMVAAHGWDIAGAIRAGLRGAFVARPGQLPDPFAPPEILGDNLVAIAAAIIEAAQDT